MEEENSKSLLMKQICECIKELKNCTPGSEEHRRLADDIRQLTVAYDMLDRTEFDHRDADRKFIEEIRQKDLERDYRDILERDRMRMEAEIEDRKMKENKRSGWRDAAIKVGGILIPTTAYIVFLALGMRLEFLEHGSLTGYTTKELFKALHPKLPMM